MSIQAISLFSQRFNKSQQRQDTRKPSLSARRRPTSKDRNISFTNSSILNSSQLDNQRSSSQNANYAQESFQQNYVGQQFDAEQRAIRMSQNTVFQGSQLIINQIRKENKSPLTTRPRYEEQKGKPLSIQDLQVNKLKTIEEYKQREMMLQQRARTLEKDILRLQELVQKENCDRKKQTFFDEQELLVQKNTTKLREDKEHLQYQILQLQESLDVQKVENLFLKKYVSSHTSKLSDQKSISTRTNTIASINSSSGYKCQKIMKEHVPSYISCLAFK